MQSSRDSSVWRTLAIAFGDGLAFGVGITLTRNAARLAAARTATTELHPTNGWIGEVEQRRGAPEPATRTAPAASPPGHEAADAVLTVIDGRFAEIGGQIDRRLVELEGKIKAELDELDTQDHALAHGVETRIDGLRGEIGAAVAAQRQSIDTDMRGLRAQMTAIHKDFAETLARLVDEQIAKTIAAGLQTVKEELRETIREENRIKDQQISELRERVDNQENTVVNLVMSLGQSCLKALERVSPPAPPTTPTDSADEARAAGEPGAGAEIAAEADPPGFARTRPRKPLWRDPIVPSFLAATGSLLLLHYL